jgi:hypothetical protein
LESYHLLRWKNKYGSGESWQLQTTKNWIKRITTISTRKVILFGEKMRLAFLKEALKESRIQKAQIVLVDCSDKTGIERLTKEQ